MKTFLSLAEQVRSHYLKGYLESLSEFRSSHSPSAPEVMFELPREAPLAFKLYRVDMGSNSSSGFKVKEANLETHLEFEPFRERGASGLELTVFPIAWNGVEFQGDFTSDTELLEQWALKWLDAEDQHQQNEHGLQSVIHSVTKLEEQDGLVGFSIDFGSAPVEALSELLAVFGSMGATSIKVSSSCLG
jgi:hypothetical protein